MHDMTALQRQSQELERLRKEVDGAIATLQYAYRDELAGATGRAKSFRPVPGWGDLDMGLNRVAVSIPGLAVLSAEELIALLKSIHTKPASEPQLNSLGEVPEEDWNEFMGLHDAYLEALEKVEQLGEALHKFRIEKIEPYR